jgi:glucose-6-phosphate isomerase
MAQPRPQAGPAPGRVRLDYTNALAETIGDIHGISSAQLQQLAPRCADALARLQQLRSAGPAAWLDLPAQTATVECVVASADVLAARCDDFVVLGIGGSALGAVALLGALRPLDFNQLNRAQRGGRPRVTVLDNVDPDLMAEVLGRLDLSRTIFNVVTKSGSTGETMAQLAIVQARLRVQLKDQAREHLVVTTDPSRGDLRALAQREGYLTFDIPPAVGGRFSVLSPVGIDVRALLAGAAAAATAQSPDLWANPAALNAAILYLLYERGKHITVLMPYSQHLRDLAAWYRQLWAESLGKTASADGRTITVGPTPVQALGVTDQHSQLQLYLDGPNDKVINFVGVDRFAATVEIPPVPSGLPALDYLAGQSLNALVDAERLATALALAARQRPNVTWLLPEVSPHAVGQLVYLLEVQTALLGFLFGIDPFDQPAVEAIKVATFALLGRPGYQSQAANLARQLAGPRRIV